MSTRVFLSTTGTIHGHSATINIEADSAADARNALSEVLAQGSPAPTAEAPAAAAPAAAAPAAEAAPDPQAGAAAAPSAHTTATPTAENAASPGGQTAAAPAAEHTSAPAQNASTPEVTGEQVMTAAKQLLGTGPEGEGKLKTALGNVGAATVGTCPAEKRGELLAAIQSQLGA